VRQFRQFVAASPPFITLSTSSPQLFVSS
jgi:hypothetical protein